MNKSYRIEYNRKKIELKDLLHKNLIEIKELKILNKEIKIKLTKLNTDHMTYKQTAVIRNVHKNHKEKRT